MGSPRLRIRRRRLALLDHHLPNGVITTHVQKPLLSKINNGENGQEILVICVYLAFVFWMIIFLTVQTNNLLKMQLLGDN